MKHLGTINLESEHLLLRKMRLSDAEMMFKNWTSDERVCKYLSWLAHQSIEDTKSFIEMNLNQYDNLDFYSWLIIHKQTSQPIGTIGMDYHKATRVRADYFEAGYCIGYDYWNQGLMSEALACVINFMFNQVEAHRIVACHEVNNIASRKVMVKCGMKSEGIQREAGLTNQKQYCSFACYSILDHEYKIKRKST